MWAPTTFASIGAAVASILELGKVPNRNKSGSSTRRSSKIGAKGAAVGARGAAVGARRTAVGARGAAVGAAVAIAFAVLVAGCFGPTRRGPEPMPTGAFPSTLPTRSPPPAGPPDGTSQPTPDPVYPAYGNPAIDVLHYDLALDWQPATHTLTGTATLTIRVVRATGEVALDFAQGFAVTGAILGNATVGDTAVQPTRHGDRLVLPSANPLAAGAMVTAVVRYRGTPKETAFPGVRSDVSASGAQIQPDGALLAMQEPYGAFTWFPCNDQPSDKALFDVAITAPTGWTGVSSGRFMGTETAPGGGTLTRWHGTEPSATYVVALAVDRFNRHDATGPHGLPVTLWVRPADEPAMLDLVARTPAMLAWLERRFGTYPFSSAGVVVVADRSAMETQTMVTMGTLSGRRGESVLLHELSHQWFGDAVTPSTWRDLWLNEGFATYVETLYGVDRLQTDLTRTLRAWWENDKIDRSKYGPPANYDPQAFAEHNVYFGPALMLHELRRALGDDQFFAALHDWVQHHRYGNADRVTFTAWMSRYTGRDLAPILDKWLDSTATPAFPG